MGNKQPDNVLSAVSGQAAVVATASFLVGLRILMN